MADGTVPWEAYAQAAQAERDRKQAPMRALAQLIQTGGQVGGSFLQKHLQQKRQQEAQSQLTGLFSPMQGPTQSGAPMTNPPPNPAEAMSLFSRAYPGQQVPSFIGDRLNPVKMAKAQQASKPPASYWVNPDDPTDVSPLQKPGYIEYKTTSADAGSKVTGMASSKEKAKAMEGRNETWNRKIDTGQIDYLAKSVGFTPHMISQIQNTATRAQRGLEIVGKPGVTWQELNAAGIDFAGIMHGGAPHVGEVINSTFKNWHEPAAKWQTYITGNVPGNVPEPIRIQMQKMLQGVADIDYKFIQASNKFNKQMIAPTIRGGITPGQNSAMQGVEKSMIGNSQNSDLTRMSDDELRRIAAGGQ